MKERNERTVERNGILIGEERGKKKKQIEIAKNLLAVGISKEIVAQSTELTMEEIEKTIGGKNDFADCIRDGVEAVFYNAQTVVPADKEDAE